VRISFKLALAFLCVLLAGVAGQALLSARWHAGLYRNDAIRDLRTMGRTLAPAAATVIHTQGLERAAGLIEQTNDRIDGTRILWIPADALDASLLRSTPDGLARVREGGDVVVTGSADSSGLIYLYQPVLVDGGLYGAIELSEPLVVASEILARRLATYIAIAAVLVAACALVAFLVSRRWVERPLAELIAKARRVGAEDFSGSVELGGHREFTELATEMNVMTAKLDVARTRVASETASRVAAIEQLRHADRLSTIGRLAAGIAHELGTPLNVVSERADMIVRGEHAGPEGIVQSALAIQQQSVRMTAIVRHLLDFARRRKPDRRPTRLDELARSALRLVEPLLERRGVRARLLDGADARHCDLDPGQLQQVLINLLTNAVDVTKPGGEVRVRVECPAGAPAGAAQARCWACIVVEDDGPGMTAEVRSQIFEPFFTTKSAAQGTGLGLAIAEEIVREHGGSIEVRSELGRGTQMRVWLPQEGEA
jgi:signal transduction histidine kinase